MELSKEERAFKDSTYEAQPTIADGLRDNMIRFRRSELENLPDKVFLGKVNGYFERNATMGGEKVLKDLAMSYAKRMETDGEVYRDDANPFGIDHAEFMNDLRDDMKDMFAKVSIKQAKVVETDPMTAVNSSVFRSDIAGDGRTHAAMITVNNGGMFIPGTDAPFGDIADGFVKNHPNMDGMDAEFVMVDNSNGKFKNMTCRMLIDLSQENGDGLDLEFDDFAAAIDSLGGGGSAPPSAAMMAH